VSWRTEHAREVFVDGIGGFGSYGSTQVILYSSRDVVVRAVGAHGHDTLSTGLIRVVPAPRITSLIVPGTPAISLRAEVSVRFDRSDSALARLDHVLDRRRSLDAMDREPLSAAATRSLRRQLSAVHSALRTAGARTARRSAR
jgi:hypothetical protein